MATGASPAKQFEKFKEKELPYNEDFADKFAPYVNIAVLFLQIVRFPLTIASF